MEHFESTSFGMRMIITEWTSTVNELIKIRLVPMIHIGERSYYRSVETILEDCDIILYEAMNFKTGRLRIPNRMIVAKRLGLVTQKVLDLSNFEDKLIHADIDDESGQEIWNKLSLLDKFKYNFFFPIYMYFQDISLTRKKLVKYYMKSKLDLDEVYGPLFDEKESIKRFIHEGRNKRIFQEIDKIHDCKVKKPTLVAVVYGAGHMKAVETYLRTRYGYKILKGAYLEAFKI